MHACRGAGSCGDVHILGIMSAQLYSTLGFVFARHLTFLLLRLSTSQFTVLEGTTQSMVLWLGKRKGGDSSKSGGDKITPMACILIS